jgi:hypothetical protein
MNKKDAYSKLVTRFKSVVPPLENKEQIIDYVMNHIESKNREPGRFIRLLDLLFGWVHVIWLRRAMAVTAICLIILFTGQQFLLMQRLTKLENQIIKSVESESVIEDGPGMKQQVLMNLMFERPASGDSITLSREEFEALLKAYILDLPDALSDPPYPLEDPSLKRFFRKNLREQTDQDDLKSKI